MNTIWQGIQSLDQFLRSSPQASNISQVTSSTTLLWLGQCSASISSTAQNLTSSSFFTMVTTCSGLDQTFTGISKLFSTTISESAKSSIKEVASLFFTHVPPLFSSLASANKTTPFDYTALAIIGALTTFIYSASTDKKSETLRNSVALGATVGTTLSWAFDQDLYSGALHGTLAGILTGMGRSNLPSIPNLGLQSLLNQITQPFVAPNQRWDWIIPGITALVAGHVFSNLSPIESKPATLGATFLSFIIAKVAFSKIIFPITNQAKEIIHWTFQNTLPITTTAWLCASISNTFSALSEYRNSALSETCPNQNH